jgi:hypothetical protein
MLIWLWPHPVQHYIYKGCGPHIGAKRFPYETLDPRHTLTLTTILGTTSGRRGAAGDLAGHDDDYRHCHAWAMPLEAGGDKENVKIYTSSCIKQAREPLMGFMKDGTFLSPFEVLRSSCLGLLDLEVLGSN